MDARRPRHRRRGWLAMAVALVATLVAVSAAVTAAAATNPPASPWSLPLPPADDATQLSDATTPIVALFHLPPLPPPRQPAWRVKPAACLARFRANGNAPAYLCCIDRSMGFCAGHYEYTPAGGLCTVDWTGVRGGGRCCVARSGSVGGVRWTAIPRGLIASPTTPRLAIMAITCRSVGVCAAWKKRVAAPEGSRRATETAGRCGSWAPKLYQRCERTLCEGSKMKQ